ncbi:Hypothetical_protein [Hexamita inflata]|uniref:Hypothetical_protein n=1 Tax=Hexamita inflata TaxID=28002 RepID=A0ABP1H621_9EUKA
MLSLVYMLQCYLNPVAYYNNKHIHLEFFSTCEDKGTQLIIALKVDGLNGTFTDTVKVKNSGKVKAKLDCDDMIDVAVKCEGYLHSIKEAIGGVLTVKKIDSSEEEKMDIVIVYDPGFFD